MVGLVLSRSTPDYEVLLLVVMLWFVWCKTSQLTKADVTRDVAAREG